MHGLAGSVLAHQIVWHAPNQNCFEHRSIPRMQFGSLCCILASKALVPLIDSFLVNTPPRASVGLGSHPSVPHVPRGLHVVDVDHEGVLVALDVENHMGLRPSAPFANVPSKRHRSTPKDCRARPCLRASKGFRAVLASPRNATWLILPVVICLSQRLSQACVSMN